MSGSHEANAGPPPPVIDPAAIELLRELGGEDEPDLLSELVGVFLADAPTRLADMYTALATGDFELLERAAHTLKSSAAHLGALILCEQARTLEAAARARDGAQLAELAELATSCKQAFADAEQALQRWVD